MLRLMRIYLLHAQNAFTYRSRAFVWFLMSILNPLLTIAYWQGAFRDSGNEIHQYWSLSAANSYYLLLIVASSVLIAHIEEDIAELDINQGKLASYILRPFSYLGFKLCGELPYRLMQGSYGFIVFVILLPFFGVHIRIANNVSMILAGIFVSCIAFFLSFMFKLIVGLTAIWFTDTEYFNELVEIVLTVCAGFIIPLFLFPPTIRFLIDLTPFPYMIYYPILVFQGQLVGLELVKIILIQCTWIGVLMGMYRVMWSRGIRHYTGVSQ